MPYKSTLIEYESAQQQSSLAAQAPALMSSYKRETKANSIRLLTDEEFKALNAYRTVEGGDKTPVAGAEKVFYSGDYSKFEELKIGAVAYQCTKLFYQLREEFGDDGINMDDPEFRAYALENIQNPFFRLAMEMAANTADLEPQSLRLNCRSAGVALNEQMMVRTLAVPDDAQRANLAQALGSEQKAAREIDKNRITQMTLAKTMFLSHLGSFHVVNTDGKYIPYHGSLTETMAHGGRTTFYFSKGEPGENTIERNLFHDLRPDGDRGCSVESRMFATHAVKSGPQDEGVDSHREKSAATDISDNYGMNTAVGGLGNRFSEKTMLNDGKSGHFYIKKAESTKDKGGYLMVGMEGSETLARGKTGRLHFGGGSSMASAFISGKGAPGAKLGGRLVDLSIWDHEALGAMLRKFNEAYGELQDRAYLGDLEANARLTRINQKLSGKMLNGFERRPDGTLAQDDLSSFLKNEMGITSVRVRGKEVDVDQLAQYRAHHGERNFDAMNAAQERRQRRPRRTDEYVPSADFEKLAGELSQAKRFVFGKETDSAEMKAVKEALDQTMLLVRDPDIGNNPKAMKTQLKTLEEKAQRYLIERSNNNRRKQIVTKILLTARKEEQIIDRIYARKAAAETPVRPRSNSIALPRRGATR